MFKRTVVESTVNYDLISKKDGVLTTSQEVKLLQKCNTKAKAEIILSKLHKGCLIDIKSITFSNIVYAIDEEVFYSMAKVIETSEITE